MSKIFIISNTNFNATKNLSSKEWQKVMEAYFYTDFLPFLTNSVASGDVLIHLGNLLHKTKSIDLNTLKFIQDLFEKISEILPVYIIQSENDKLSVNILKNFSNIHIIKENEKINNFLILTNLENINIETDYCFFNYDYLNSPNKDIIISKLKKFKKCYNGYYDKNSVTENIKNLGGTYNIDGDDKMGLFMLGVGLIVFAMGMD